MAEELTDESIAIASISKVAETLKNSYKMVIYELMNHEIPSDQDVFIYQPKMYVDPKRRDYVCKLNKYQYGHPESSFK